MKKSQKKVYLNDSIVARVCRGILTVYTSQLNSYHRMFIALRSFFRTSRGHVCIPPIHPPTHPPTHPRPPPPPPPRYVSSFLSSIGFFSITTNSCVFVEFASNSLILPIDNTDVVKVQTAFLKSKFRFRSHPSWPEIIRTRPSIRAVVRHAGVCRWVSVLVRYVGRAARARPDISRPAAETSAPGAGERERERERGWKERERERGWEEERVSDGRYARLGESSTVRACSESF